MFDKVIKGDSIDVILQRCLTELVCKNEVDSRLGDKTREILGMSIILEDPRNVWQLSVSRKHNIFHQIGESLAVLAGNLDMKWLTRYLPNAKDFSDDYNIETGEGTWRADYGSRIRKFKGVKANSYYRDNRESEIISVDQWKNCIDELKINPNSRRAVIVLWSPCDDGTFPKSLDYPCNDMIQFLIRDNKLHMIVTQRSSDCIWGFSAINCIEFSLMQQLTASVLNVELGSYRHQMGSFHLYDKMYERSNNMLDEYNNSFNFDICKCPESYNFEKGITFEELDEILKTIYELEILLRTGTDLLSLRSKPDLLNVYSEYRDKYPKIVNTLSIPLHYKRSFNSNSFDIDLDRLHPALRENLLRSKNSKYYRGK